MLEYWNDGVMGFGKEAKDYVSINLLITTYRNYYIFTQQSLKYLGSTSISNKGG